MWITAKYQLNNYSSINFIKLTDNLGLGGPPMNWVFPHQNYCWRDQVSEASPTSQ